jgi:hypothetical protein
MTATMQQARKAISPVWDHRVWGPALKVVIGYVLIVQIGLQYLFGKMPLLHIGRGDHIIPTEIVILGLVYGSLYGLIGMGIILVYRANRIINFAQAQLGSVPAVVALLLIAKRGLPWVIALPIAVIGGALLGGAVEVTLVRRFANAPRLILTVVTIGIGFLLLVLEFYSKQWVGGNLIDTVSLTFPTPFSHLHWKVGVFTFRGDHFAPLFVVGALVMALGAFFKFTDIGIAVRASAENGERASSGSRRSCGCSRRPCRPSVCSSPCPSPASRSTASSVCTCCSSVWPSPSWAAWRACRPPSYRVC